MAAPRNKLDVGGQAVIEGVMMRSPRSFAVVCRRPSGQIVIREDAWRPVWGRLRFLRWPLLRGTVVLVESLANGLSALSWSARQQVEDGNPPRSLGAHAADEDGQLATWGMMALSIALGLALFVGLPHLLAWALGAKLGFGTQSLWFHAADGVIKVAILVSYLGAISLVPDVRRVFQYHGAEHKAIFTYEKDLPLTVDHARAQSRFHPRCGTSFLLIVVLISVALFAVLLRGRAAESPVLDHAIKILVKVPLMLPIAGLSYEVLKLSGRFHGTSGLARAVATPGTWLQRITTREPTFDQLEIALLAIRKTLWRERRAEGDPAARLSTANRDVEVYASAADVDLPLA